MTKMFYNSLFLLIIITSVSFGSTTGKISGVVKDAKTGELLPGANIIIQGTNQGASTDMNGFYTILNVMPGKYILKASFIGYTEQLKSEVRVMIDRTIKINFLLNEASLNIEAVTVIANKEIVRPDVSASVSNLSIQDVEVLPVIDFEDVIALQAGIEDGLVIRGGGLNQTQFNIDGFETGDGRTNEPLTVSIPVNSVQEIAVQTGGFNAEYGMVRSGLINTVIREGSKNRYSGAITINYKPTTQKHFGISPFDRRSNWLRPYFDDAVAWSGTNNGAWDKYTRKQFPEFIGWNEISRRTLENDDPSDDLSPTEAQRVFEWEHRKDGTIKKPDYNVDIALGGPVPIIGKSLGDLRFFAAYRKSSEQYLISLTRDDYTNSNLLLKFTFDATSNIKFNLMGLYGESFGTSSNTESGAYLFQSAEDVAAGVSSGWFADARKYSDSYFGDAAQYYSLLTAKMTHVISQKTFYEISLKYSKKKYYTTSVYERDTSKTNEIFPGYFVNEAPFGYVDYSVDGITGLHMGGHIGEARDYSSPQTYTGKFDYSTQFNRYHYIKAGLEISSKDLNLDYGGKNSSFPSSVSWNTIDELQINGSIYIQDKIEFEGLIANLGVRADYIDPNTLWVDVDPFDRNFFSEKYNDKDKDVYFTNKVKSYLTFSPRLGIAHPISENAKFYFNYGHFRQLPSPEGIYELRRSGLNKLSSIGTPDLPLEKTIAYEIGYEHNLFDQYLLLVSAYYKDISIQRSYVHYVDISQTVNYWKEEANNYQDILGFEITLRKRFGDWVTGFANYSYMVYTSGYFGLEEIFQNPSEQRAYNNRNPYQEKPLAQPYARINLNIYSPKYLGQIFGDWSMSFLYNWRSGEYSTWNPNDKVGLIYNVQWRDYQNVDLRISKSVFFESIEISLFADFRNLLNEKQFTYYGFSDGQDEFEYLSSLHMNEDISKKIGRVFIPGDDKPGDYREADVEFTPIEPISSTNIITSPYENLIYYDMSSKKYMEFKNNSWTQVDGDRMDKLLENKAYIDMPNQTAFTFLNPRNIYFGLKFSFNF